MQRESSGSYGQAGSHESMSSALRNGCESLRTGGGKQPVVETRKEKILGKLVVNHQSRRQVNTVKAPERMPADHPFDRVIELVVHLDPNETLPVATEGIQDLPNQIVPELSLPLLSIEGSQNFRVRNAGGDNLSGGSPAREKSLRIDPP